MQNERAYFVSGHTAKGFVNFFNKNIYGIDKVIVVNHQSNKITTKILQALRQHYYKKYAIEIICSPQSKLYIEGIIIRSLKIAVISKKLVGAEDEAVIFFDVGDYVSPPVDSEKVRKLEKQQQKLYAEAHKLFQQGLKIHVQVERIYIKEMDFEKADTIAHDTIQLLFENKRKKNRESVIFERLFGTNTAEGVVNLIPSILEQIGKIVHIKGRAGTGKSVFMKTILNECIHYGYDVEVYRCSFDPNSVDMIIIRDLDICFFDSTPPHAFHPQQPKESVIDLYNETVTPGTDEKYKLEVDQLTKRYKDKMNLGLNKLSQTVFFEEEKELMWNQLRRKTLIYIKNALIRKIEN